MEYRMIDWESYPRKAHFEYFNAMADPYAGVTAEVDITRFLAACRGAEKGTAQSGAVGKEGVRKRGGSGSADSAAAKLPFFLSFLYCAGRAANAVPELRRRIVDGRPVEFASCDTSHTVMRADGAYSYCRLNCMQPFRDYLPAAQALQEEARAHGDLDDGEDALSLFFVSTLPWVRYTAIRQPVPSPADSNPRLTWGKYVTEGGRTAMPVTLLVNHALVDGVHMAGFYDALERELTEFAAGL